MPRADRLSHLKAREKSVTGDLGKVLANLASFWLGHVALGQVTLAGAFGHLLTVIRMHEERGMDYTLRYLRYLQADSLKRIRDSEPFNLDRAISRASVTVMDSIRNDLETRKLISASVVAEQVEKLRRHGFDSFHFYTLNQADLTYAICHLLGVRPQAASKSK